MSINLHRANVKYTCSEGWVASEFGSRAFNLISKAEWFHLLRKLCLTAYFLAATIAIQTPNRYLLSALHRRPKDHLVCPSQGTGYFYKSDFERNSC